MLLRSLCAALVAAATIAAGGPVHADDTDLGTPESKIGAATAAKTRAATPSRRALRAAARATPLQVTIQTLTPSEIPRRGKVELAGTVTNTDDVTWLAVNVYSFVSEEPMTSRAQLAAAAKLDESQFVGRRIVEFGTHSELLDRGGLYADLHRTQFFEGSTEVVPS